MPFALFLAADGLRPDRYDLTQADHPFVGWQKYQPPPLRWALQNAARLALAASRLDLLVQAERPTARAEKRALSASVMIGEEQERDLSLLVKVGRMANKTRRERRFKASRDLLAVLKAERPIAGFFRGRAASATGRLSVLGEDEEDPLQEIMASRQPVASALTSVDFEPGPTPYNR